MKLFKHNARKTLYFMLNALKGLRSNNCKITGNTFPTSQHVKKNLIDVCILISIFIDCSCSFLTHCADYFPLLSHCQEILFPAVSKLIYLNFFFLFFPIIELQRHGYSVVLYKSTCKHNHPQRLFQHICVVLC